MTGANVDFSRARRDGGPAPSFRNQHHATRAPNGDVLLFDNYGYDRFTSRALRFEVVGAPLPGGWVWWCGGVARATRIEGSPPFTP